MNLSERMLQFTAGFATGMLLGTSTLTAGVNTWTTNGPPGGADSIVIDPGNTSVFYSVNENQAWRSTDQGGSWQFAFLSGLYPGYLLRNVAAGPSYTVYVGTCCFGAKLLKTSNAGLYWTQVASLESGPTCSVAQILVNPMVPSTIYAVIGGCKNCVTCSPTGSLLRSLDGGQSFALAEQGLTGLSAGYPYAPGSPPTALAMDPLNPSTLYVRTADGFFKSTDAGNTWSLLVASAALGSFGSIDTLVADPSNPMTLYGTNSFTVGIVKSTDGGRTFAPANSGLTNTLVRKLVIDPKHPSHLYVATEGTGQPGPVQKVEVFASDNGGVTWRSMDDGLPDLEETNDLAIDPAGNFLLLATKAGVFEFEFPPDLTPVLPPPSRPGPRPIAPRQ